MVSHHYKNPREHIAFARSLRHQPSHAERRLWFFLNEKTEHKFRQQHPIKPYVADFACIKAKLIIELDGMTHDTRLDRDAKRDEELQKQGWRILRFRNEDVYDNVEGVVLTILEAVRLVVPAPP